ncbi:aconitate hydratase AcnA [Roseomonas sp. NAR14]|uniref:Aconitate hydratase n=1 Tax=Roseomonas acroporae TaxID=2937791 RepID=A0A9X1YIV9_9PROT|nr:aconitate hydratase AcnA [Roseomonas acroporae]MCK8786991.1 aconitate hydratase AcnA [Roseomonas acroporae]
MAGSFGTRRCLTVGGERYAFHSLPALAAATGAPLHRLPLCLRVLLENLLRHEDGQTVTADDIRALASRGGVAGEAGREVSFHPVRVLMPDSSGIPLLVDLAAMRDAVAARGLDPARVNPLIPADLVIDHSVAVDHAGTPDAVVRNMAIELERNRERYALARWAEARFRNLRVVPPGNGIVHQVNVEHLASVVADSGADSAVDGVRWAFPDSLVGTDSHTPMVNGLGVFGWGVGGIEAMTALLGQPVSLVVPRVVGCRLVGATRAGLLGADIALAVTARLRPLGLVGAAVEFCGPGLDALDLPNRATIANMAPEYGATMSFFPVDGRTLDFLRLTGRPPARVALVEAYARAQGLFRDPDATPDYDALVEIDLGAIVPGVAGPGRPEAWRPLAGVPDSFRALLGGRAAEREGAHPRDGDVVIASITSCTNTANPRQMLAAGLLARNALARGLARRDWVKTSLSPGSRAVTALLARAGLLAPLAALGFDVTGYGCMSCAGNAGPLDPAVESAITAQGTVVAGVLSSNRNFEGRLHPLVRGTYLASPPLVVAYALAGSVLRPLDEAPLGHDAAGRPVLLRDVWPGPDEVESAMAALGPELFRDCYGAPSDGGAGWQALPAGDGARFAWDPDSRYIRRPPFLDAAPATGPVTGARILLLLGDDVTTDHISPGGDIPADGPAGRYLIGQGVAPRDFSSYIARRANHEVMIRGTFAGTRLRNLMLPGREGGVTRHWPGGEAVTVHEAATRYAAAGVPLVVVAGRNYGNGSSRDWAAKGTRLLGVRAVIAESFERIHRSNLVGMGVLPLQMLPGTTRESLGLTGEELVDLPDLPDTPVPGSTVTATLRRPDGTGFALPLRCRVDTAREAGWVRHGGILPFVLHALATEAAHA